MSGNDRRLELKKISSSTHLRNAQIFSRHFNEFGSERIKSISPDDIEEFLEEQIPKHNLSAKAFSNLKSVTKGFLKRAKKIKLIDFNVEELFQDCYHAACGSTNDDESYHLSTFSSHNP